MIKILSKILAGILGDVISEKVDNPAIGCLIYIMMAIIVFTIAAAIYEG